MTTTVNTGQEFVDAVRNAQTNPITVIKVDTMDGNLDLPMGATIPKTYKALSKQLEIDLQGHNLRMMASAFQPWVIGRENPTSDAERDRMQSHSVHIHHGSIDGKQMAAVGILSRCTYGDEIIRVEVASTTRDGIVGEFIMNALIRGCEVANVPGIGIALKNGTFAGAGRNASGSNTSRAMMNRVFPKHGMMAGFYSEASGATIWDGCIVDAATYIDASGATQKAIPQRGFQVVNTGSTTTKNIEIIRSWAESLTTVAMFDLDLTGGYGLISGTFPQYGGVMIKGKGSNYSELHVNLTGNVPGGTKFQTEPNGLIWSFMDNPTGFDFKNPANWVGGIMPQKWFIENFGGSKEKEFFTPGALKLNGSPLITKTAMDKALEGYIKKIA